MRRLGALVVVGLLAVGCSGTDGDERRPTAAGDDVDTALLDDAIATLRAQDSGTFEYATVITLQAIDAEVGIRGTGEFADGGDRTHFVISFDYDDFPDPSLRAATAIEIEVYSADDEFLTRVSDDENEQWIRLSIEDAVEHEFLAGIGSNIPVVSVLEAYDPLAVREVSNSGSSSVIQVDMPADAGLDLLNSAARAMVSSGELPELPDEAILFEVTLSNGIITSVVADLTDLVRALASDRATADELEEIEFVASVELADFGSPVTIELPEPDDPLELITVLDLQRDDCFESDEGIDQLGVINLVDCTEPHRWEVYGSLAAARYRGLAGEDLDLAVIADCEEEFEYQYGVPFNDTNLELWYITPPDVEAPLCIAEAMSLRTNGDLLAVMPFPGPSSHSVSVTESEVVPVAPDRYRRWLGVAATDSGNVMIAVGPDDAFDPDPRTGNNDMAIWRSADGGLTFELLEEPLVRGVEGEATAEHVGYVDDHFLVVGQRWVENYEPVALRSPGTGLRWELLDVELPDGAIGGSLWRVVEVKGRGKIVGFVVWPDGRWTPAVWTVGAESIELEAELGLPTDDIELRAITTVRGDLTIHTRDYADGTPIAWRHVSADLWERVDDPSPNRQVTSVVNHTFAIGPNLELLELDGEWQPLALETHDDGIPGVYRLAANDDGVLAAGVMLLAGGRTAAMWWAPFGTADFRLIWVDVEGMNRNARPVAIEALDDAFVVVGYADPEFSYGFTDDVIAWRVEID